MPPFNGKKGSLFSMFSIIGLCVGVKTPCCVLLFYVANEIVGFGGLNLFLLSYVEHFLFILRGFLHITCPLC